MVSSSFAARRRPRNARAEILDAAQQVASRDGAARLTIDAIAREVGMTKGGVLYNFPSKAVLLKGMLERMIATFQGLLDAEIAAQHARPNPTLRGLLRTAEHFDAIDPELLIAIIATAAEDPGLLDPLRGLVERTQARIVAEAADQTAALVLVAALDGLKFQRLMRMPPTDPVTRRGVLERLRTLADAMEARR